ncbi:MAG: DUF2334 domain-containing protein [Verrucomicrobiota bacterium]
MSQLLSENSMSKPDERSLIVSFHDLTPETWCACEDFLELMSQTGITKTSLLVIPSPEGAGNLTDHKEFAAWLRERQSQGHEICVHGYSHRARTLPVSPVKNLIGRFYTDHEGEFQTLGEAESLKKLQAGTAVLRDSGLKFRGFVPPAWLINKAGVAAVARSGLEYVVLWGSMVLVHKSLRISAPVLVYSSRSRWRRVLSVPWTRFWHAVHRKNTILRIAVHPGDLRYCAIRKSIRLHVQKALRDRQSLTYCDLVDALRASKRPRPKEAILLGDSCEVNKSGSPGCSPSRT